MIRERNIYRITYVKNIEPIFVASTSFGGAAHIASLISDNEILSISKADIIINVKFD